MSKDPRKYEMHDFYCMNCGKKSMSIPRLRGRFREVGHKKVMYCPHCKETVNMVECRNDEEAYNFKLDFEEGLFKEEAQNSISYIKEFGIYD